MTKFEFLKAAAERTGTPAFGWTHEDGRNQYLAIGRDVAGKVFVFLDFAARPDNQIVGQGVGWTPGRDHFLAACARRENPPIQRYDGSLRRLQGLERPRDFEYDEGRRSTASLSRPFTGFDLATMAPEVVIAAMREEIRDYALPYLCLMLRHRFALDITVEALATGSESCAGN